MWPKMLEAKGQGTSRGPGGPLAPRPQSPPAPGPAMPCRPPGPPGTTLPPAQPQTQTPGPGPLGSGQGKGVRNRGRRVATLVAGRGQEEAGGGMRGERGRGSGVSAEPPRSSGGQGGPRHSLLGVGPPRPGHSRDDQRLLARLAQQPVHEHGGVGEVVGAPREALVRAEPVTGSASVRGQQGPPRAQLHCRPGPSPACALCPGPAPPAEAAGRAAWREP